MSIRDTVRKQVLREESSTHCMREGELVQMPGRDPASEETAEDVLKRRGYKEGRSSFKHPFFGHEVVMFGDHGRIYPAKGMGTLVAFNSPHHLDTLLTKLHKGQDVPTQKVDDKIQ